MITFTIISQADEHDLNPGCGPLSVLTMQLSFDPFDPHVREKIKEVSFLRNKLSCFVILLSRSCSTVISVSLLLSC